MGHKTFFWCIIIRQENGSVRSLITNHMIWSFECLGKKEVRRNNQAKLASIRSRDNWLPPVLKRADGEMDLEGRQSATRRDRQSSSTASSHRGGSWRQLGATFWSEREQQVWKDIYMGKLHMLRAKTHFFTCISYFMLLNRSDIRINLHASWIPKYSTSIIF